MVVLLFDMNPLLPKDVVKLGTDRESNDSVEEVNDKFFFLAIELSTWNDENDTDEFPDDKDEVEDVLPSNGYAKLDVESFCFVLS